MQYDDFYAGIEALVIGSVTYEWILKHIEAAESGRTRKAAAILSSRALPCGGDGVDVRIVNAPLADAPRDARLGGRATCGSSAAATSPPVRGRWTTR